MDISLPFRVFAIDPAITKSGWSVLDLISLNPLHIKIVKTGEIDGQKLLRTRKEMAGIFQSQFCVLDALNEVYQELMKEYDPDQIVVEGAYGHTHLSALISLTLVTNVVRKISHALYNKDLVAIPPTITKVAFTGRGGADKDVMRLAYQTNDYLEGTVPDAEITEHEIDAVGHGVGFIKVHITKEVIQLSGKEKRALKAARKAKALEKQKEKQAA